jgi:hypothetical protein
MFPPPLGRPTDSLVAVYSACGFGGGVSRVLLDGRELPPSCALVVSSDLHELQVQWLACVQFFLMLSPYFHQKMIEASHLLPIVPPGLLRLCHDVSLSVVVCFRENPLSVM